jgi:hypothetical protein
MLDDYAAGIREFSDERLLAIYEKNLNLRADDLIEITRAELNAAACSRIELTKPKRSCASKLVLQFSVCWCGKVDLRSITDRNL